MNAPDPIPGIPPLAGLCSLEDARHTGLSVDEVVRRLKRLHYAFKRLHGIFNARITAEPQYELKTAFSHHAYLCAEQVSALRARVGEMREPPLGLEQVPDDALEQFFDEILGAPATATLVEGLYGAALPAVDDAIARHLRDTHPLADAPSIRLCRIAELDLGEMRRFGDGAREAIAAATPPDADLHEWTKELARTLAAAGGLDGTATPAPSRPVRRYSATAHVYDGRPARDGRFAEAHELLDEAAAGFAAIEAWRYVNETQARRAECLVLEGRWAEALEVASALVRTSGIDLTASSFLSRWHTR